MKKIRLNVADLGATEILTREQLKSVFGGSSGSDSGSGSGGDACNNTTGMPCNQVCFTSEINTGACKYIKKKCTCVSINDK